MTRSMHHKPFAQTDLAAQVIDRVNALNTDPKPGRKAFLGTNNPVFAGDGEGPLRRVQIDPFHMTATTITNFQFSAFVVETGYKTEAERFGWSFVFRDAVADRKLIDRHVAAAPWWCKIIDADWVNPRGTAPISRDFEKLPVIHVSWNDAQAFAMWAGGRLPTEAEWEHAARGGLGDVKFPWGDKEPTRRDQKCHFGQIEVPHLLPEKIGPIPAVSFEANGYGLFNMVGNVWEWTTDTAQPKSFEPPGSAPSKYLKGGSYMCHPKTCYRYRIAARIFNTIDTTIGHTGFRVVFAA